MWKISAAVAASLLLAGAAPADRRTDTLLVWADFLAAGVAHERCHVGDGDPHAWSANLTNVTIRASQAFRERSGGVSEQRLEDLMAITTGRIRAIVRMAIDRGGCGSSLIQSLQTRYGLQARPDLFEMR